MAVVAYTREDLEELGWEFEIKEIPDFPIIDPVFPPIDI